MPTTINLAFLANFMAYITLKRQLTRPLQRSVSSSWESKIHGLSGRSFRQ